MKIFILGDPKTYKNYALALEGLNCEIIFDKNIRKSLFCDALLLTGGGDVAPGMYDSKNKGSYNIDYIRDVAEINLIKHFYNCNKPIMGICRGIQILNVALGGDIMQNVSNEEKHSRCGDDYDKTHIIRTTKNSFLTQIYGDEFYVTSAHHQAIGRISNELIISAISEDGVIEAVEHKSKNIFAVQFHPERMTGKYQRQNMPDGKLLFEYFIKL